MLLWLLAAVVVVAAAVVPGASFGGTEHVFADCSGGEMQ